jgi:hypothetical protein
MNCADLEILLCDYLDGTLAPGRRADVERHIAGCPGCAAMARDVSTAVSFMERAADVEPPPELLTRILFELPPAHHARARQPGGLRRFFQGRLQPVLQPRFAMGFAMTILSFSLLGRFAGISPRQITLDDLRPAKVWQTVDDKFYRGWQRTVKFYENLRFVYEIQTQLHEWRQKEQEIKGRAGATETPSAGGAKQRTAGTAAGGGATGAASQRTKDGNLRNNK